TVSLVAVALFVVYAVRKTLFIFVLAVFLSYMIYPLVRRLVRVLPRLSRSAATATVFAVLALLLGTVLALAGPRIADQASNFSEQLPALLRDGNVIERLPLPDWLVPYRAKLAELVREHAGDITGYGAAMAQDLGKLLLTAGANVAFVVLIPILAFIMITSGPEFRSGFLKWVAHHPHAAMWRRIVDDLDTLLGGYIRALLILAFATIASYSIVFSIAGVPYGLLLALIAGVLEFIPVLGPLLAALLCVLVAGISGYGHLWWIVGFIAVYRLFQDYVLNPYLMSNGVAVPALLVLFGLLAGEELAGVAGVFLSTPVLAAALILCRRVAEESSAGDAVKPSAHRHSAESS
ncbi:MAG: AI-2E family transporter, partial [Pseudomonadota bacterium]|nr:AI-2E family transporter [Pseudomonadota bacterium]